MPLIVECRSLKLWLLIFKFQNRQISLWDSNIKCDDKLTGISPHVNVSEAAPQRCS